MRQSAANGEFHTVEIAMSDDQLTPNGERSTLRIGLAAVRNRSSVDERLAILDDMLRRASEQQVAVVCFPEAYIPGLRGLDFAVPPPDQQRQESALRKIADAARRHNVAVIVGMEWAQDSGLLNLAFVISGDGAIQGCQTKNQIAPTEEPFYVPGDERHLFHVNGVAIGVTICHEGWRYPESVRWAVERGARVVFHPQMTGSDISGPVLTRWGESDAPYYEKAMTMRALENTVWFASANYATNFQESATAFIDPDGHVAAWLPYGKEDLLIHDIDLTRASGYYARRLNHWQYRNGSEERQG